MPKDLERDLGLPAVLAISIGAMIGSGIFILPGLALKTAGPAVILSYFLAGLFVLPAALSKSEMATAMPEAGGTYLYIERGMGPLLGTIAGVGSWFSLTFKGALALVGGAPYLLLLFESSGIDVPVTSVAIGAAVVLLLVNLVGVKQTGRLQVVIVAAMLVVLIWFVGGSSPSIDTGSYDVFFGSGIDGIFAATAFVYVSYAGVTKVASIAEEIENPDRNIPLGMLGSLGITTLLYVALVAVMVGVGPAEELSGSEVPMAIAAEATLGIVGMLAISVAAVIALISTANAGILSSSRYPLAMSRDRLAPPIFSNVSDRFGTPAPAISVTGAVLLVMVAFVPIDDIAKFASAFKILVFVLINVALIGFREADNEEYDPSFETPLYPFPQLFGIVSGVVLLGFMLTLGVAPVLGAVAIIGGSIVWYYVYVRWYRDVDRQGAATDAFRQKLDDRMAAETEETLEDTDSYDVLVVTTERTSPEGENALLSSGAAIARARNGTVRMLRFDEVPDQTPLETASDEQTPGDVSFERRMENSLGGFDVPIEYGEIVSHDTKHAIVNQARHLDLDAILLERRSEQLHTPIFGGKIEWIKRHTPCDVIEIEARDTDELESVALVLDRGPNDPIKVLVADALATEANATIELLYAVDPAASSQQRGTAREYLHDLEDEFDASVSTSLVETENEMTDVADAASANDLIVVSAGKRGARGALFGRPTEGIIDSSDCTAMSVDANGAGRGRLRRSLDALWS